MEATSFFRESRVLIVAGKGGAGKTTIAAALARAAADCGLSVLIVELEGRSGLGTAFGAPHALDYEESLLAPAGREGRGPVRARRLTPDDALLEYMADHGLQRISRRLLAIGVVDVVATAIPGIRDVLVLGKVKQLERNAAADVIIVDAPATGHAMTFLTSARGLLEAARAGPVRTQATEVDQLLSDPARCRVILVCLPEEMPVSETVEAAYLLEDRAGVHLGPVIMNDCDHAPRALATCATRAALQVGVTLSDEQAAGLDAAREFRLHRLELQEEQVQRLARELPLPVLRAPHLRSSGVGPAELRVLAPALTAGLDALDAGQGAPGR